jgi:hypothetical protein
MMFCEKRPETASGCETVDRGHTTDTPTSDCAEVRPQTKMANHGTQPSLFSVFLFFACFYGMLSYFDAIIIKKLSTDLYHFTWRNFESLKLSAFILVL